MDHRADSVKTLEPISRARTGPSAAHATDASSPLAGIVCLAILELLWLAWFLIEPLPNANNTGVPTDMAVRRGWLVLKAFPQVVPETSLRESILGHGIDELSHLENLPQRVPILMAALLIAAAAIGLGDLVLRWLRLDGGIAARRASRPRLRPGCGAARRAGAYCREAGLARSLARCGWGSGSWRPWGCSRRGSGAPRDRGSTSVVVESACDLPVRRGDDPGLDAALDRLRRPRIPPPRAEGVFTGRPDRFLPHNVYTNMPFNVEMLHLLAMEVMGDWWWGGLAGQLLVAFFGAGGGDLDRGHVGRRRVSRGGLDRGGRVLSTRGYTGLRRSPTSKGPLCFYHAALVWVVVRGQGGARCESLRFWGLAGPFGRLRDGLQVYRVWSRR